MKTIITESWNSYLDKFNSEKKDIYFLEEYVKLYENESGKALCAVCSEDENILLMPFIRKEIDSFYDFETAYGYGGPISNTDDAEWINKALCCMQAFLKEERYICGFIRFHSLLENASLCEKQINTFFDRNTVAIKTNLPEAEIWADQITSKNRNMIRKAEKNELIYKAEYDFASIDEFITLYNTTMRRLKAEDFYFFNNNYYKDFVDKFQGKAFLGTVRKEGKLICAALFMYSGNYGHYHLEGSNHDYSNLAANNLLLWKTALELGKLGVKEFHLGGGYNSDTNNSLLKFKKSFSNNLKKFYIGKWIFNPNKYMELKKSWSEKYPEKVNKYGRLLLCYRY